MRQSRKAGLVAASGVRWFKYECEAEEERRDSPIISDWECIVDEAGLNAGVTITGRTGWYYGGGAYTGYLDVDGSEITISASNPGTVYQVNSDGTVLTQCTIEVHSDGAWYWEYRKTLTHNYYWVTIYPHGNLIGTIRAKDGEYPEESNGYAYVDIYSGHTIMEDSGGRYFSYTTTKPKVDVPAYTLNASIEDGVLVVTGDGSAAITDDVLVTTGAGSASVENNILYVR